MNKAKATVLIAEDHKPLLMALRDILEEAGYTILSTANGVEALEAMEQTRPDLIIADIMMPALNGYGLYEHIRRRPEWSSIPIIFLTSRSEPEDVMKGEALGVDGYITKPFNPDKLLDLLHTLLFPEA